MISVRSYKRRQGRMLASRQQALDESWPDFGIEQPGPLDPESLFGRQAPLHLEIGFGMGDALLATAHRHPENNYLGIEVYLPGIGQLLLGIRQAGLTNVRIDRRDAMEVMPLLPAHSLDRVSLFFPDPWPKKRHHKRRLVQSLFVAELHRLLRVGGQFHAATDWEAYARQIRIIMEDTPDFANRAGAGNFYPGPVERPPTKFEKRGLLKGHLVSDLLYERL